MRFSHQILRWSAFCLLAVMVKSFSTLHVGIGSKTAPSCRRAMPSDSHTDDGMNGSLLSERKVPTETTFVYIFPVAAAVSAFTFYEGVSKGFHELVQAASQNNWVPVDGGQLVGDVMIPAINGPVLGTIGLLFATLVSTTISNLYQRQMNIHSCLVREVDDLRRLGLLLRSLPEPYRGEAQTELKFFVNTVFEAARERSITDSTYRDVSLAPIFLLLNKISDDCETDESLKVSGNILGEGYDLFRRINDQRITIAVLLRPAFPALHYANLLTLASCICLVFLIETDRDLIFFLAGFQLRLLWSILVGIFAMMATVIYDLESPFGGSYNVSALGKMLVCYVDTHYAANRLLTFLRDV